MALVGTSLSIIFLSLPNCRLVMRNEKCLPEGWKNADDTIYKIKVFYSDKL